MENTQDRENKNKKLLILALLIALLACSFGFAAYSRSIDLHHMVELMLNLQNLQKMELLILMYILQNLVKVLHIHSMVLIKLK